MMPATSKFIVCATLLTAGCAPTTNLLHPATPAFSGSYAPSVGEVSPAPGLRIVTFNIKLGRRIERAISVLAHDNLAGADVIALQEMDELGVERIARALRLNYVYYPGSIHPTDHRYFGPALLSRWPIKESWKLILPHEGWIRRQRRTATAAILEIRGERVLAYAVHLETQLKISEKNREDQVLTVLNDAARFSGPVVIAGDFNSETIGPLLVRRGYQWLTSRVGPTIALFSWDHIFVRPTGSLQPFSAGMVRKTGGASDHRPVWAVVSGPMDRKAPRGWPQQARARSPAS
jgi:endonuclease/exonuclease/phosphatase family metal-dependent hydrolase